MLTSAQINTLNRARDVLERIQKKAGEADQKPFSEGQLSEACTAAELALFNVLNLAGDVPDDQLFNRKKGNHGNSSGNGADGEIPSPLSEVLDQLDPKRTVA